MEHYYNPVHTYQGVDCLSQIKTTLNNLKSQHVLLLSYSNDLFKNNYGKELLEYLKDVKVTTKVFTISNPDVHNLFELYEETKDMSIDLVIGVGGGSVLDVAKSLCCIYGIVNLDLISLRQHIKNKTLTIPHCPWLAIPTTSGTGSEVTCWATIWDKEMGNKMSLESPNNYAYAIYADPRFTTSMPIQLAVSSALDAVAHATEAYWSKGSNLISRIYALEAIRLIFSQIDNLVEGDHLIKCYDVLSKGSMLAGMAFSNTKTTACHSISYPLTLNYDIPHGVAVSMLLGPVMKVNFSTLVEPQDLLDAYGVIEVEEVGPKIVALLKSVNIKVQLSQWGVGLENLEMLTEHCFTAGRMENNPVNLTNKDVYELLKQIY